MSELYGLAYSPWTLKARWSLDVHGVSYRYHEYVPLIGEPALRMRAGAMFQPATVPLLVTNRGALTSSWEIAEWSANESEGVSLIPAPLREDIIAWDALADRLKQLGRARLTRNLGTDRRAAKESVPGWLRGLGPLTSTLASMGVKYVGTKYAVTPEAAHAERDEATTILASVRDALYPNGTLLGTRTYADIAIATALQFVSPVDDPHIPIGPASRPHWEWPELAASFDTLLQWRDAIFVEWQDARAQTH